MYQQRLWRRWMIFGWLFHIRCNRCVLHFHTVYAVVYAFIFLIAIVSSSAYGNCLNKVKNKTRAKKNVANNKLMTLNKEFYHETFFCCCQVCLSANFVALRCGVSEKRPMHYYQFNIKIGIWVSNRNLFMSTDFFFIWPFISFVFFRDARQKKRKPEWKWQKKKRQQILLFEAQDSLAQIISSRLANVLT